jgi:hypothetical protein
MAGYSEIDADELFPSDDSMAIFVAQSKELAIVPSKALAITSSTILLHPHHTNISRRHHHVSPLKDHATNKRYRSSTSPRSSTFFLLSLMKCSQG